MTNSANNVRSSPMGASPVALASPIAGPGGYMMGRRMWAGFVPTRLGAGFLRGTTLSS